MRSGNMATATGVLVLGLIAGLSALPTPDPVVVKWDDGQRYSYLEDDSGKAHLVDNWMKVSDLAKMARYDPDSTNMYHLFTRDNPSVSQPLVFNDVARLAASNFNAGKMTVVLMHGFAGSITSGFNTVLVPAFLAAVDCNVIVLDWSSGSYWGPLAIQAGQAAGRFITWLIAAAGTNAIQFRIVGYSVGGHGAGIIARNVVGDVGYVTGLDPAERWDENHLFRPDDGVYTEVIHTSSMGEETPMGHVDFYPNGGENNPGCLTALCDHYRSYYFLAESLTRGGFTGTQCASVVDAQAQACSGPGTLNMGGLYPKTGSTGIYHLRTNPFQPFSQG